MKSKNLMKLARQRRLEPQLQWLRTAAAVQTEASSGQGQLLDLSFSEWCRSLRIKTDKGLQPFELFDWQESFADLILGEAALTRRAIALLSSRQTGKTSLLLAIAAYLAQSRRQFSGLIVHRTTADSYLLCRRLKSFLGGVKLKTDSLSLLEFADSDSAIHFRSCNPKKADGAEAAGRGLNAIDLAICEEASHTANLKDTLGVIAPTLTWSAMGIVCFVGTASSKQSYYYENLVSAAGGAENLENTLSGIRAGRLAPYQVMDTGKGAVGVVTNWRAIERFRAEPDFLKRVQGEFDLSDSQMDSEYELIFGSSVDSAVFDFALIMAAQDESLLPLKIQPSRPAYIGVDPSGTGRDYACAIALESYKRDEDGEDYFKVSALYRKRTGTSEQHLKAVIELCEKAQPSCLLVETNSMGAIWLEHLAGEANASRAEGFNTSQASKEVLIGRLILALEAGVLRIPPGPIVDELLAFRRLDNGKLQASGKAHDDCVMALALALHATGWNKPLGLIGGMMKEGFRQDFLRKKQKEKELSKTQIFTTITTASDGSTKVSTQRRRKRLPLNSVPRNT